MLVFQSVQFVSRAVACIALLAGVGLGSSVAAAPMGNVVVIEASLSAASEVPPNESKGTGTLEATLNKDTNVLNYTVSYSGLSGPATGAHFHGPALPGATAAVVLPFASGLESPIKGTAVLTPEQVNDLLTGKWYVNVHTAAHAGGEIRGQALMR